MFLETSPFITKSGKETYHSGNYENYQRKYVHGYDDDNKLHGSQYGYFENGEPAYECKYLHGVIHGEQTYYNQFNVSTNFDDNNVTTKVQSQYYYFYGEKCNFNEFIKASDQMKPPIVYKGCVGPQGATGAIGCTGPTGYCVYSSNYVYPPFYPSNSPQRFIYICIEKGMMDEALRLIEKSTEGIICRRKDLSFEDYCVLHDYKEIYKTVLLKNKSVGLNVSSQHVMKLFRDKKFDYLDILFNSQLCEIEDISDYDVRNIATDDDQARYLLNKRLVNISQLGFYTLEQFNRYWSLGFTADYENKDFCSYLAKLSLADLLTFYNQEKDNFASVKETMKTNLNEMIVNLEKQENERNSYCYDSYDTDDEQDNEEYKQKSKI